MCFVLLRANQCSVADALFGENSIGRCDEGVTVQATQTDNINAVAMGMHNRRQRLAIERAKNQRCASHLREMLGEHLCTVTVAERQLVIAFFDAQDFVDAPAEPAQPSR
jgi:hypothetical protein